jgi:type III pantothenate kinase
MNPLLLAVDSGNTRVKWGLHDGRTWLEQGAVAQGNKALLEQEWKNLREPSRIVISNVGGITAKAVLSDLISRWKAESRWITAVAYQCGVRNYYTHPAQLGSDRWAALIAAWELEAQGCLVVDAGTALTVDALSDTGEFLGGIIAPGIDRMQKMPLGEVVFTELEGGKFCDYPDNTADAVYSGAMHASAGTVERMSALLARTLGRVPDCLLCGGAAQQLQPQLNVTAKVMDNLVLDGLVIIAREGFEKSL